MLNSLIDIMYIYSNIIYSFLQPPLVEGLAAFVVAGTTKIVIKSVLNPFI